MIIRTRVLEARLAAKISSNPDLAREFGLEMSIEKGSSDKDLDNRIDIKTFKTSTEAHE